MQFLSSLGKRVTNAQAKCLNELGLSFAALQDLRSSSKDSEEFSKALLDSGVRSKPLRDELGEIIKPKRKRWWRPYRMVVLLQLGTLSDGSLALGSLSQLLFNTAN